MNWAGATHYEVLHVSENAPLSVIRASYKTLMQQHHPDRYPAGERAEAENIAARLNAAMDELADPDVRSEYDRSLALQRGSATNHQSDPHQRPPGGNSSRGSASLPRIRPWPRFWARLIDYTLFGIPFAWFFSRAVELDPKLANNAAFWAILNVAAWIPVEALLLSTFGTTLGKRVFRIAVTSEDGSLSYVKALRRSISVWWKGVGIGFPFVSTIATIFAYYDLKRNRASSWDRQLVLQVIQGEITSFRSFATGATTLALVFTLTVVGSIYRETAIAPSTTNVVAQCVAPAIWDPWTKSCRNIAASTVSAVAPLATVPATADYLAMGVDTLRDAEFQAGAAEWLKVHSEYNNEQDIATIQSHLNSVLGTYPRIELRAALDMSLQRAIRAGNQASANAARSSSVPASPRPVATIASNQADSVYEQRFEATSAELPQQASETVNPMPLNSIDTPSWQAIKTGRIHERVAPVDPSRVIPGEQ